jgi:hypothetical protein
MGEMDELSAELDTAMKIASVAIPADRYAAVLTGYAELKRHIAVLRAWSGNDSPASVFVPGAGEPK